MAKEIRCRDTKYEGISKSNQEMRVVFPWPMTVGRKKNRLVKYILDIEISGFAGRLNVGED